MYFAKSFLLYLYKKMKTLYTGADVEAQGGTQFASELKYFLAADEFLRKFNKPCNYKNKTEKDDFAVFVGNVVLLGTNENSLFTKNFSASIDVRNNAPDYNVGSNFFSTNACKVAQEVPDSIKTWPTRAAILLTLKGSTLSTNQEGYNNLFKEYLVSSFEKSAILLVWLARFCNFKSKENCYTELLNFLSQRYTETLLNSLQAKNTVTLKYINELLKHLETSNSVSELTEEDLNIEQSKPENNEDMPKSNNSFADNHDQIIFYGVPGSGKSFLVDKKIHEIYKEKEEYDKHVIRVVFHPDYTNSDFVGQIMPFVEDGIDYRFKAGPFTRILKHAYQHHNEKFYLVIEEINRGNAAAIFGELFQLLDREKDGFSKYEINNTDIAAFIMSQNDYYNDKSLPESVSVGGDKWILDSSIRLPPNLSILATMNTSDQNVFTLDNAFQRRWNMEYIPNTVNKDDSETFKGAVKNQYESTIGSTGVKWGTFRKVVNEIIADPENSFSNAEDKQLGLFFAQVDGDIEKESGTIKEDDFSNKVLKYLWNDIFKRDKSPLFKDSIKTFGALLTTFKGNKAFDDCFKDELVAKFKAE